MVRVLTVVEIPLAIPPATLLTASFTEMVEALQKKAEATVRTIRDTVATSGLPVETSIREGDAGREIVEEATAWGADLVLVGSHGRTGLQRVLMGSVAQHVVSHAPCSVEVVRGSEADAEAGVAREDRS
jgi:nucleotide-binding universal stress UspA family protein